MTHIYNDYNKKGNSSIFGTNFGELRVIRNAWYDNRNQYNPIIIPAVHLEMGFHDNKSNAILLRSIQFRESSAEELAQAVIEFFNERNSEASNE